MSEVGWPRVPIQQSVCKWNVVSAELSSLRPASSQRLPFIEARVRPCPAIGDQAGCSGFPRLRARRHGPFPWWDNLWTHRAIYAGTAGRCGLFHVSGAYEHGYWGEIMSTAAKVRGLTGLVN